jgi:nicotinamide phosphoribosyltransferase
MLNNIILQTDSYKASHWKQYPPGTEFVYSYFESRGGEYEKTVFFGLQYFLKEYLFGFRVAEHEINEAKNFFKDHFGNPDIFYQEGWEHIYKEHQGKLPLIIKAIPEGTVVDTKNVLFTVENTCPKDFWLTSYLETLLEQVWYPTTIATKSFHMKQIIKKYLNETGNDAPDFKLHDFGYRGSTSQESAGLGGAAHLVNFMGSDTLAGIRMLQSHYHATMPAFSIPAAEHSTITSWGRSRELEAYSNMLQQFPKGLVAVVSDSYDIFYACEDLWGGYLKGFVENRDGCLVIRPDSGIPEKIIPLVLEILTRKFGYTTNTKGYKVLPPYLRIIQGDGINESSLLGILETIKREGYSADNMAFGSGGGLLQSVTRDTCRFAYKCSNVTINGKDIPVSKDPVTDPGKKSKKGRLALRFDGARKEYFTIQDTSPSPAVPANELQTVFKDGQLLIDQTLDEIRSRAAI